MNHNLQKRCNEIRISKIIQLYQICFFENRYNDFQNTKYQIPNTNYPFDKMEEECNFGLYSDNEVDTFSLSFLVRLFVLQHHGQEAFAGFLFLLKAKLFTVKDEGLVLDVFKTIPNPESY